MPTRDQQQREQQRQNLTPMRRMVNRLRRQQARAERRAGKHPDSPYASMHMERAEAKRARRRQRRVDEGRVTGG